MKKEFKLIDAAWENRELLKNEETRRAVLQTVDLIDKGKLRVAEPVKGLWEINNSAKKAVLLYFLLQDMKIMQAGDLEFFDKIPLKKGYEKLGIRVVPQAVARYGSYISPGVIMMPSYVNIGAYVDEGTMIDTWATVGSCAQIGKRVHISGGVGIGGVLEPVQASPVIIEDDCFIGSRCIIVEGVRIMKEAVLGAGVSITKSTKIIDVTSIEPTEYKGVIPARSVVIPGTVKKKFPAGNFQVPAALIIGKRKTSTDLKTSLNDALREFNITV